MARLPATEDELAGLTAGGGHVQSLRSAVQAAGHVSQVVLELAHRGPQLEAKAVETLLLCAQQLLDLLAAGAAGFAELHDARS